MTSYPACNYTLLSRKPCNADKKLLWNAIGKSWSIFQNPLCKIAWSAPGREITMTSYPAFNKTSFSWKPCIPDKKLLWNTIRKSSSLFHNPSCKIVWSSPQAAKSRWRHIRLSIELCYLGNHASQIKSYYGTLSGSHCRCSRIRHEKSREAPPGGGLTITSYPVSNTTSISWKPCMVAEKLLWITIMKYWSLSNFYKKKTANINLKNWSVYKCCWWRESVA